MNTHGLDPRLAEAANQIDAEDEASGWHVNMRAGSGTWCSLYSSVVGVLIEIYLQEGKVVAKAVAYVTGFSGKIESMELVLPNKHLQRVIMQIETIKWFCPKDNINDHYHNVALEYMQKRRALRKALRAAENK